jgi:hypothetical protein
MARREDRVAVIKYRSGADIFAGTHARARRDDEEQLTYRRVRVRVHIGHLIVVEG